MLSRKNKLTMMKIVSLFSVIRGYNIPIIALAQYLAAIFILAPKDKRALEVLLDFHLFIIVLSSSITIASGYIINSFYDHKKDLINKPQKTILDRLISQKTKLYIYFSLNFFAFFISFIVSWRAAFFFATYIFLIWFYSHKLKKYLIIGNLTASLLAVLPFFGILMYYKNFYEVIFAHAIYLYLLLLVKEMIKDLENIKGDIVQNYRTIPVVKGEYFSKVSISILFLLSVLPVYFLIEYFDVGYMDIYFYISFMLYIYVLLKLWKAKTTAHYLHIHNLLKLIIVFGVFSIVLIKPSVLIHGRQILNL